MYQSTKTYGNDRGLSCCFRQWRADSHCNKLHGYSLGFRFTFEAVQLDKRNWVYDFGNCGWIKKYLETEFDHRLIVAKDDPKLFELDEIDDVADINVVKDTGCEKFAEMVYNYVQPKVYTDTKGRVILYSVEVFEHGANSAVYINDYGSSVI